MSDQSPNLTHRRLSVVQLVPALVAGGAERSALEIGRALVEGGHTSIVVSEGGRLGLNFVQFFQFYGITKNDGGDFFTVQFGAGISICSKLMNDGLS